VFLILNEAYMDIILVFMGILLGISMWLQNKVIAIDWNDVGELLSDNPVLYSC